MESQEVKQAVGLEGETVEQKRERLRTIVGAKSERQLQREAARELMAVESEIAAKAEADLKAEAEERILGIRRALGSLLDQLEQDGRRLAEAAQEYVKIATALNARFDKATLMKHEATALVEVFKLPAPDLPALTPPAQRSDVLEAGAAVQNVFARQHGRIEPAMVWKMTDRGLAPDVRSFEELDGTPGRELIRRKLGK